MGDVYRVGLSGVVATRGGDGYGAAILCVLATLVTYVGVAKMRGGDRADYVRTPLSGQAFTMASLGTRTLSGRR